ncbi:glutathione transferase [Aureococcus anophagefferens]|nr:glutathione transferase [Aureococcus anophagefferens]
MATAAPGAEALDATWQHVAAYLGTPGVLRAAQACRAWRDRAEACLWSAGAVAGALAALDACEAAAAAGAALEADARGRTARPARRGKLFAMPADRRRHANRLRELRWRRRSSAPASCGAARPSRTSAAAPGGSRGVAEDIRYMLAMAKVPYEDKRFSFSFGVPGDFSTIKRPERVGRVPSLRGGSASVVPWLELFDAAKEAGELDAGIGKVPILEVDGVKATYQKVKGDGDEAKAKYFGETLPGELAKVEKSLGDAKGPWLVGCKPSRADVVFMVFLTEFFDNVEGAKAATPPKIQAAIDAVSALDAVKGWKESRPQTPF